MHGSSDEQRAAPTVAIGCGPRAFALLLALLVFIPFASVLLGLKTFAVRDFGLFSYPNAYFQKECFWRGQLPFWNPFSCCGVPFLAQFNTLALYPLSLIYLLLPLTWSLPFFCLLHLYLGGLGMYFLAARWTGSRAGAALAGLAFAFNGLSLNFLMWPSHIATFAWLPWVILLTESGCREGGRKLALAALAAAMQLLAGGPETILFTWLVLFALTVMDCRRRATLVPARRFVFIGLLAVCLAAVQCLPFADFAAHSNRSTQYGASDWSMPLSGWGNYLVPQFQTARWQHRAVQSDQYWTTSYYAGIGIIFLTALALWHGRNAKVRLMAVFVLAALILAMGDHAYVYLWLRKLIPALGFFRFPIKFVIVPSALLPLLAAYGLSQYEQSRRSWRPEYICGSVLVALVGLILFFARFHPAAYSSWPITLNNALSRILLLVLFVLALRFRRSVLPLLVICWLDLLTPMPWQNPTLDPSVFQPNLGRLDDKLNPEPKLGQSRLMLSSLSARQLYYHGNPDLKTAFLLDRASFLSDLNLLDNIPKVDGFYSLYLRDTDRILWLLDDNNGARLAKLEDFLGVCQTIAPGKVYDWMPRVNYMPAVTVGQAPVFADNETAFTAILDTHVDFRKTVYLPPEAASEIHAKGEPAARVASQQFDFNRVIVRVESPAPAMVLIGQSYYHPWRAKVDGKPVPLWRADTAFQALETPAGTHSITIDYKDTAFNVGLVLTVLSGIVCSVMMFIPGASPAGQQPAHDD